MRTLLATLLLAMTACSPTSTADTGTTTDAGALDAVAQLDSGAPDSGAPIDSALAEGGGNLVDATVGDGGTRYTLTMPPVSLEPGAEGTVCVQFSLGNATPQLIRRIHVSLGATSHHLIFYRMAGTAPTQTTPAPCEPFAGIRSGVVPLYIGQSAESELAIPAGVGIEVDANQMVRVEEHFVNLGTTTAIGTGSVTVDMVDPQPGLIPSNLLFWGPTAINIPARSTGEANFFRLVPAGTQVFGLTTHQHHFGTLATISRSTAITDTGTELYRNRNWSDPPLTQFSPPLAWDGSDGFRLHCEYNNTSAVAVRFGESAATEEMCFFWAYYYPSHGFDLCLGSNCTH